MLVSGHPFHYVRRMQRAAKIATGVSALVVAGLVALAAPTVATAVEAVAEWRLFHPAADDSASSAQRSDEAVEPERAEEVTGADGEELISAGNGTWFSAQGPGNCTTNAAIHPYGAHDPNARLAGELTDMGATDLASGDVGYTADGLIATYTVAAGDTLVAIGERFCVDYVTVGAYNDRFGTKQIQPGDVLVLRP